MNNEQIIILKDKNTEKILLEVFNNVNQIFLINSTKFQEITDNLGIEVSTEELGGGTKYGLGYILLRNGAYLVFWVDNNHNEYYIYTYRETEDVYTSESILSSVYNALVNSFDALMEHGKYMDCMSCSETRPNEKANRVINSGIMDNTEYCYQCKLVYIKSMIPEIDKYTIGEVEMLVSDLQEYIKLNI